jgi:hypothetical protein
VIRAELSTKATKETKKRGGEGKKTKIKRSTKRKEENKENSEKKPRRAKTDKATGKRKGTHLLSAIPLRVCVKCRDWTKTEVVLCKERRYVVRRFDHLIDGWPRLPWPPTRP